MGSSQPELTSRPCTIGKPGIETNVPTTLNGSFFNTTPTFHKFCGTQQPIPESSLPSRDKFWEPSNIQRDAFSLTQNVLWFQEPLCGENLKLIVSLKCYDLPGLFIFPFQEDSHQYGGVVLPRPFAARGGSIAAMCPPQTTHHP